MRTVLRVVGMDCAACGPPIEMALRMVKGVSAAKVDYKAGTATVDHDVALAPQERLVTTIALMGYKVSSPTA